MAPQNIPLYPKNNDKCVKIRPNFTISAQKWQRYHFFASFVFFHLPTKFFLPHPFPQKYMLVPPLYKTYSNVHKYVCHSLNSNLDLDQISHNFDFCTYQIQHKTSVQCISLANITRTKESQFINISYWSHSYSDNIFLFDFGRKQYNHF